MPYCTNCGASVNPEARFCPSCGKPLVKAEMETQPVSNDNAEVVYVTEVKKNSSFKRYLWLIILAVILVVMAVTVPDKQAHMSAVKSSVMATVAEADSTNMTQVAMALGNNIIDKVLDSQLKVDSYVFFSLGKIETKKGSQVVSLGVLTHVFVGKVDKDKFNEAVEQNNPFKNFGDSFNNDDDF